MLTQFIPLHTDTLRVGSHMAEFVKGLLDEFISSHCSLVKVNGHMKWMFLDIWFLAHLQLFKLSVSCENSVVENLNTGNN